MPSSPDASFTQKLQDGGWIPELVVTFATENDISVISAAAALL